MLGRSWPTERRQTSRKRQRRSCAIAISRIGSSASGPGTRSNRLNNGGARTLSSKASAPSVPCSTTLWPTQWILRLRSNKARQRPHALGQESGQQPARHRDHSRLQHETEEVRLDPTLGDPPLLQTVDSDRGPRDRLPCGGDAHEFPEVRAAQRHPLDDVVSFGDEIIDRLNEVREGGQDGGGNFLEGLNLLHGRHVREVQHESRGEELIGGTEFFLFG